MNINHCKRRLVSKTQTVIPANINEFEVYRVLSFNSGIQLSFSDTSTNYIQQNVWQDFLEEAFGHRSIYALVVLLKFLLRI